MFLIKLLLKLLDRHINRVYCYKPKMTENEVYQYFLVDIQKEPHKISLEFYKELNGLRKEIIDLDLKNYKIKGNNNLIRLIIKYPTETENTLQYIKKILKRKLFECYLTNIYCST